MLDLLKKMIWLGAGLVALAAKAPVEALRRIRDGEKEIRRIEEGSPRDLPAQL
jgi:hypothetical protein